MTRQPEYVKKITKLQPVISVQKSADLAFLSIGTRVSMARFTAEPMPPEELSTCSMVGASFSRNSTAPSAASTGSFLATVLISARASLMRWIGVSDFQSEAVATEAWGELPFVGGHEPNSEF